MEIIQHSMKLRQNFGPFHLEEEKENVIEITHEFQGGNQVNPWNLFIDIPLFNKREIYDIIKITILHFPNQAESNIHQGFIIRSSTKNHLI